MASQIDMINMALTRVGSKTLTSIDDKTQTGATIKYLYDLTVEFVISRYNWSSCIRLATLAPTTTKPIFGYQYAYQLPRNPKLLKLISVVNCSNIEEPYEVSGSELLSNSSSVSIQYLASITNSEEFGVYLTKVIVAKLSYELAFNQVRSTSYSEQMYKLYLDELNKAIVDDGQQKYNGRIYMSREAVASRRY